jgi:hypothetical protein
MLRVPFLLHTPFETKSRFLSLLTHLLLSCMFQNAGTEGERGVIFSFLCCCRCVHTISAPRYIRNSKLPILLCKNLIWWWNKSRDYPSNHIAQVRDPVKRRRDDRSQYRDYWTDLNWGRIWDDPLSSTSSAGQRGVPVCCGVLLECVDQKILDGGTFKSRHAGKKSRVSLMECSIK